jgi:hypothetical protein
MAIVLEAPSINEAGNVIREALSKRQFIVIIGKCRAEYQGRSSSKLGAGERALIIKRDGAALIHRPLRCEPVNWQPPGSSIRSKVSSEGRLEITVTRKKPSETLEISFEEVRFLTTMQLVDNARFSMIATEEDVQRALLARPELIEKGFTPLSRETNLGDAGFIDILGEDRDGNLVVVEIKRTPVGNDAVFQLKRYIAAVKSRTKRPLRGIIAAPQLRKGTFATIQALGLEFRRISLTECAEIIATAKDSEITDFFGE